MFDVARGNQEDAIVTILQTESGISSMGWFGPNQELIWCASMTRGLTVWNTTTGDRLLNVVDFYMLHCEQGIEMDYVVGCATAGRNDSPMVLTGNQDGCGFVLSASRPDIVLSQWQGHQVWFMNECI